MRIEPPFVSSARDSPAVRAIEPPSPEPLFPTLTFTSPAFPNTDAPAAKKSEPAVAELLSPEMKFRFPV